MPQELCTALSNRNFVVWSFWTRVGGERGGTEMSKKRLYFKLRIRKLKQQMIKDGDLSVRRARRIRRKRKWCR
jgi:hypothetical protein